MAPRQEIMGTSDENSGCSIKTPARPGHAIKTSCTYLRQNGVLYCNPRSLFSLCGVVHAWLLSPIVFPWIYLAPTLPLCKNKAQHNKSKSFHVGDVLDLFTSAFICYPLVLFYGLLFTGLKIQSRKSSAPKMLPPYKCPQVSLRVKSQSRTKLNL